MLDFLKNQNNKTFNKANILPVIGLTIGFIAGAAAFNPAFLGYLGTALVLSGFTPALFGVVAAFLIIGSVYQIYNNRKIAVAKAEAIKAAENNSVLEGLTKGVKAELKQASIISETVKGQGQDKETLYLQLSADAYKALTTGKGPGDVITLHAFINGEDVEVKFNHAAPAAPSNASAAPNGAAPANASAAPAKVELTSVGGKDTFDAMKKELGMDSTALQVQVSSKTREGLKSVANSSLMGILAEQVVTKVVGAPAAASTSATTR